MAATRNLSAEDLRETLERINRDISKKEGQQEAELAALKKNFGVKKIDDAYDLLKKLEREIDDISRDRAKLIDTVNTKLKEFGYV